MRWVCLQQSFHSPDVFDLEGVWHSPDTGRFALLFPDAVVIVEGDGLFPGLKIGNAVLALAPSLYGGHNWWAGGGWCVFRSLVSSHWMAKQGSGPAEPVLWYDADSGAVDGDAWYEPASDALPMSPAAAVSPSATFSARGTATGSVTVSMFWPRWRKGGTPAADDVMAPLGGQYAPFDGATGNLLLGTPAWRREPDGAVFQHRSSGAISQFKNITAAWRDRIVPVTYFDPDDESGDFCFYGDRTLRLRTFPRDGEDANLFTLEEDERGGYYKPAGCLVSLGTLVVPYVSPVKAGVSDRYSATVPTWM